MKLFRTIEAVADGNYIVGDVVDFTLNDGEEVQALAVKQEDDGMLFVLLDCLADEECMNEKSSNRGGFIAADLCAKLNGAILDRFPAEIREKMVAFSNGLLLRLPTEKEIFGKNVYGKEDTMITIQWDALLAEQFDMYYIDQNGDKVRPYIIHRTSMGCYERTLAWLIEKYAGKFPTWLCAEQVRVLPISDKYEEYAQKVCKELKKAGIDATVDSRSEKIGFKIREARLDKLPYMLVVGQQEEADRTVSVRSRFAGDEGAKSLDSFIAEITEEIRNKTIRAEMPSEEK